MKKNIKPLVTIITATYNIIKNNRKEYFLKTIESVKKQTYQNIEHIIIDGGSDDGTIELIKNTGLKYISEPDNGIYDAFNKGIKISKGKYINFLNSDDFFNNIDAVKISVEKLEKTNSDFSFAKADFVDKTGKFLRYFEPNIYDVFSKMPFCHQTMFVKTDVIKNERLFDLTFKSASDYDLIIRLMIKKYKYCEIKDNIVSFRIDGESLTNVRISISEQLSIFKKIYSHYIHLSEQEYENIILKNYIPTKLLYAMHIIDIRFYLNYRRFRRFLKKIITFKLNLLKGFEYFTLFEKPIISPLVNNNFKTVEELILYLESKDCDIFG